MSFPAVDVGELVSGARRQEPRALGRLLSLVEHESALLPGVMAALAPHTGHAVVVGLTGPPGVGKSTTTSALISWYRQKGCRVAVLAVDPSSPFSGGALLGDRIRMQDHAGDRGVFIRSMASRGHLGGLSVATPQAVRVLDAAGFDVVLIETVGVGQSEVEVAALADTTVLLLAPGSGDGVQAAKAGILEVGDVFVVNKADRDGAAATARDLRQMLAMSDRPWRPPVVSLVATTGRGMVDVAQALGDHQTWLRGSGELENRRRARAAAEIEALVLARVRRRIAALGGPVPAADPYVAADALLRRVVVAVAQEDQGLERGHRGTDDAEHETRAG
ncbi:methylmalonyl Co-A mutase-associated GTPase MeaB [Kineosporia sp. NBRC 101731]|uniref:methylmalonyl Co-A mutase-associated GTPase MeaB n=1 Tax=Kineosporia sp. NBRC 101731 TaxID=3032199 RepID=UPI002553F17E|nr:methylmalonyl Co-A mutase-associated GTPase MeaB [Kineosporia sp. NBRC 101731]